MTGTHASRLAALLLLSGWASMTGAWVLDPPTHVTPEHDIEAGSAFGIFWFVVVPYAVLTLWVVPSGLVALVWARHQWAPPLTAINAIALGLYPLWVWADDVTPLFRVMEWLHASLLLALAAAVLAFTLAAVAVGLQTLERRPVPAGRPPSPES